MAELEITDVSRRFGGVVALESVSLRVADGEFCVVVGPSGCGKSTLLRVVAGLETADRGTVRIGGQDVVDAPPRERDVAFVFQSYALYPHLSVRGNLEFPLKVRRVPAAERAERVHEAAELLSIGDLLERKPRELSGGQRQRVAMGRAVVRRPKLFLFDEPLSNLDARLRGRMRVELVELHRRLGATALYVTHDQAEAMTLGDRIAVMDEGFLQQVGPPMEVYRRPANRFVAGFIGTPPMNFVGDLGIRPHDILIEKDGPIEADVELVEPMGAETYLHCRVQDEKVMVVTKDPPGADRIRLRFPEEKVHRFD